MPGPLSAPPPGHPGRSFQPLHRSSGPQRVQESEQGLEGDSRRGEGQEDQNGSPEDDVQASRGNRDIGG